MERDLLEHILNVSRRMAETRALTPFLNYVVDEAIKLVGAERGYIVLVQSDDSLDFRVKRDQDGRELEDVEDQVSRTVLNQVIGTGQPLVLRDAQQDPRLRGAESVVIFGLRSIMCVPLISRGETIGAIYVENRSIRGRFSDDDAVPLVLFANQAAVDVENARLFQALQEAHDELEMRVEERTIELSKANALLKQEIAERERAEEQLQRYAAELERANEELRRFAYIVSHDLRAPLTNLKGFAKELHYALEVIGSAVDTALPHLDEEQQQAVTQALQESIPEVLGFIDSSVTRMNRFISALLELARLGRRELDLEPIDMGALVQATLETLAHQIEERQVQVIVGSLPDVVADRTSMEQIMSNILDNAVKYLDPSRPGEIEITGERNSDETTFRIRDSGRGIAEEDMDKVFAPFRRAGKQDVPGEGMGLSYVQTLVRRHSGRMWCESELGVGTTFTFTLSNHLAAGDDHV